MADSIGLGLDQSQIADAINRQKLGTQRQRNEMMRLGTSDPNSFIMQNQSQLQQAQQPADFLGAGRKALEPGTDKSLIEGLGGYTTKMNGEDFYYAPYDVSKASWGKYQEGDINNNDGTYSIMRNGQNLGTGYKTLQETISDLYKKNYNISPSIWTTSGEKPFLSTDAEGNPVYGEAPQTSHTGYSFNNTNYDTEQAAQAARDAAAGSYGTGNTLRDWETLGQLLNYGKITGDFSTPHALGGNQIADPISGLNTLYGSKPIIYDGKLLGYNQEGKLDPITDSWNDLTTKTSGNFFKKKTTTTWDQGNVGLGRSYANPSWLSSNATVNPNGTFTITGDKAAENPGWTNADYFNREAGSQTSSKFLGGLNRLAENVAKWTDPGFYKAMQGGTDKSLWNDLTNEGLFSAVFNKLDPVLDKLDPLHNTGQDAIGSLIGSDSQKQTFNQVAPIVLAALTYGLGSSAAPAAAAGEGAAGIGAGAAAGSAATGTTLNTLGQILQGVQAAQSASTGDFGGALMSGLGAANISPLSSLYKEFQGAGMSPGVSRAVSNFATSALNNAVRGGDPKTALASALFSTASGEAGKYLTDATKGALGDIGSKMVGGAASGGLNSLFSNNNAVAGSLFGGMSGGLYGFLNSTAAQSNTLDKPTDARNRQAAIQFSKLANLMYRRNNNGTK